ncbi:DUF3137 domain-containing protein [Rhodospira trueperi]|uniref:DUF3137 domain-containing protein n=1 Tax=Rhodospira trueperi TaxID=69960 RepID=A0A1G6ZQP8_9PROT|nr:DUF3137 domain-containing protein [Rhodospira trueperi]SDE05114.1 Protein of unknown function [Rhodospira trueperi]
MATPPVFEEQAPHEQGFAEVFETRILPVMQNLQVERCRASGKGRRAAALVAGLGAAAAAVVAVLAPPGPALAMGLGVVAVVTVGGTVGLLKTMRNRVNRRAARRIAPILCEFMAIDRFRQEIGVDFIDPACFQDLRLVEAFDTAALEDGIEGVWRGVRYRLAEARLSRRQDHHDSGRPQQPVEVFRGLLMWVETPSEMPTILFLRKRGKVLGWVREQLAGLEDMERLPFPDAEVEDQYDVYTSDAAAARAAVSPAFGRTLLTLRADHQGNEGHLAAAFQGRGLYLAIARTDPFLRLDAADGEPIRLARRMRAALADLAMPRQVVDTLTGAGGGEGGAG